MTRFQFLGIQLLAVAVAVGCSQDKIDQSVQNAQPSAQSASQAAGDAAKAAGDAAASASKAAGDAASSATEAAGSVKDAAKAAVESAGSAADTAALTKEFGDLFASITKTLSSVTDAAAAPEAVNKLTEAGGTLKGLIEKFNALPAPIKSAMTEFLAKGAEGVKPLAEKVLAIPGVGEVLKPHVDGIMSQLDAVAKPKA